MARLNYNLQTEDNLFPDPKKSSLRESRGKLYYVHSQWELGWSVAIECLYPFHKIFLVVGVMKTRNTLGKEKKYFNELHVQISRYNS